MALKKDTPPKIQRGISLTPEMHERIKKYAIAQGLNWNGAAVDLITTGFRALSDSLESGADSTKPAMPDRILRLRKG